MGFGINLDAINYFALGVLTIAILIYGKIKHLSKKETLSLIAKGIVVLIFLWSLPPLYPNWLFQVIFFGVGGMSVLIKDGTIGVDKFPKDNMFYKNKGFVWFISASTLIAILGHFLFLEKATEASLLYSNGYSEGYIKGCDDAINYFGTNVLYYDGVPYDMNSCLALIHLKSLQNDNRPDKFLYDDLPLWRSQIVTVETQYFYAIGEREGRSKAINNLFRNVPSLCYGVNCIRIDDFYSY